MTACASNIPAVGLSVLPVLKVLVTVCEQVKCGSFVATPDSSAMHPSTAPCWSLATKTLMHVPGSSPDPSPQLPKPTASTQ